MQISNVTFDEIAISDTATYTRLITNQALQLPRLFPSFTSRASWRM